MIKYFWPLVGLLAILSMIEIINYLNLNQIGIELVSIDPYWYGNISIPDDTPINSTPEYNQSHEWFYIPSNQSWSVRPKIRGGEEEKEPIETKPQSSNKQSIHIFSTAYLESYEITCTDNESILCPFIDYKIIKDRDGNWNNTIFNITINNMVIEKESELGISSNVTVKSSYPLKLDNEFALAVPVESKIIKGEKNLKPTFEAGDKLEYTWEIPPNTRWAKFGDMSITTIQASTLATSAYLANVTAEAGNFTHLSTQGMLTAQKGFNLTRRINPPYHVDEDNSVYSGDGTTDYVQVQDSATIKNICNNGCTFSAWAKKMDIGINRYILTRYDTAATNQFFYMSVDSGQDSGFAIRENGNATTCSIDYTGEDIIINSWYHFVGVYTNSTGVGNVSLYRDGNYLTSTTCSFTGINIAAWQDDESFLIGAADDGSFDSSWNGFIDDVILFNSTLTPSDISALYSLGREQTTYTHENLTAEWRFDDTSIGKAVDEKNINNGTFGGNAAYGYDTTGLMSCYNFDADIGNTTAYDFAGDINGNYVSTANASIDCGWAGKGGCFDGDVNKYIALSHVIYGQPEMSFSTWVYNRGTSANQFVYDGLSAAGTGDFSLGIGTTPTWLFSLYNGTKVSLASTDVIPVNQWIHVAGTYNGTNMVLYLDGLYNSTDALTGKINAIMHSGNDVHLGGSTNTGSRGWNGTIDEFMLFNRALNSSEIYNIYMNQSARYFPRGEEILAVNLYQNGSFNRLNVTSTIQELKDSNVSLRVGLINSSVNLTGLIGYLNAEDGAAQDFSGNNNKGTFAGNAFVNSTGGRNGTKGFSFDGDGDYVDLGAASYTENIPSLTISVWAKTLVANSFPNIHAILSKEGTIAVDTFEITRDDSDNVFFRVWNASASSALGQSANVFDNVPNVWKHIVGVYNGTDVMIYINGIKGATVGSLTGLVEDGNTNLRIGARGNGGYDWNGTIDDVMIFNRSLSAEEIQNLYNNQSANHDGKLYYENETYTEINNGTTQFNINTEADFALLEYQFNGNFYSPILEGDISYEAWTAEAGEDTTAPSFSNTGVNNSNPSILDYVTFYSYWTDAGGLDSYIFSWNATGLACDTWANDSAVSFVDGWANISKQIPATCLGKIGGIAWTTYANDTSDNWGNTGSILSFSAPSDTCTPTIGQSWIITHNCTKSAFSFSNPTYPIIIQDGSLTMNTYTNITVKYLNISQSVGYLRFNKSIDSRINLTG